MKKGDCFVAENGTIEIYRGEKKGYAYFWMIRIGEKPHTRTMVPEMARKLIESGAWQEFNTVDLYKSVRKQPKS